MNQLLHWKPEHRPQILEVSLSLIYPLVSILWGLDLWITDLARVLTETMKKEYDMDVSPVLSGLTYLFFWCPL